MKTTKNVIISNGPMPDHNPYMKDPDEFYVNGPLGKSRLYTSKIQGLTGDPQTFAVVRGEKVISQAPTREEGRKKAYKLASEFAQNYAKRHGLVLEDRLRKIYR